MQTSAHKAGPTTPRLFHRAMVPEDAQAFYALNSHPDVMQYTGEPPLKSIDQAREAITTYPDFIQHGYGRWGCILKETNQLIGFCGLKRLDEFNCTDVGFRFLPEHWGKGLATEACRASIDFGFQTLKLPTIAAFVLPDNAASIRVLEKCGMHHAGTINYDGLHALRYEVSTNE